MNQETATTTANRPERNPNRRSLLIVILSLFFRSSLKKLVLAVREMA